MTSSEGQAIGKRGMARAWRVALAAFLLTVALAALLRAIDGSGRRPTGAADAVVALAFLAGGAALLRRAIGSLEHDVRRLWRWLFILWAGNAASFLAHKIGMAFLTRKLGESGFNGLFMVPVQGAFYFTLIGLYGYGLYAAARAPRRPWLFVASSAGATAAMYWISVRDWS